MNRYNVKVNDQTYCVEVTDVEESTTNNEESSASICFEAIKAEYDYCVTRAEKLENKVYILLAACAFIFVLLTTQIEKAGNVNLPQTKPELYGIIIYAILLVMAIVSNVTMIIMLVNLLKSMIFGRLDSGLLLTEGLLDEKDTTAVRFIGSIYTKNTDNNNAFLEKKYTEFNKCVGLFCVSTVTLISLAVVSNFIGI